MVKNAKGFTLIELMTVFAIIAVLLTIVAPRYFNTINKSEEVVLRNNLETVRDAIGKYYHDNDAYPRSLDDLVTRKYLRHLPLDPITKSNKTWIEVQSTDEQGGIIDIKSGAPGKASNGVPYEDL